MFEADRPIVSSEQDRLGRSEFAKYLARCMMDHNNPESLVIGLEGGWASGKTSLINLILEELKIAGSHALDEDKPIVLNFSPWSYSGQNQLIYGFFRRLSSELRRFPYLQNSSEIIHLLELYVSFFTQQPMPRSSQLHTKNLLDRLNNPMNDEQKSVAWESGRDPTLVKAELNEMLKKQKHKLIIIIDNISRLYAHEITQILQIVKSMGDYANTIYLLSYDKDQVIHAINQVHEGEGVDYLAKLVQLPFEVPPISKQDLENLLIAKLQNIIEVVPPDRWNNSYWADVYYSSLKYFFNSCRDITRYLNALSFSFPRVKDIVNPVDFFALTAIEVFEHPIYISIRENKDLFTDLLENVYVFDEKKFQKDKIRCDEILERAKNITQPVLLNLLMQLFPRLHNIYEPEEKFYHSTDLIRLNKRVCSPENFDVYFRLSIPTGHMPESELNTILDQAHDATNFGPTLLRLNQDGRISKFLDLLDSTAIHKIERKNIPVVINALLDSGDLFPEGETNLLNFNTPMRIHRICHQLLHSLPSNKKRFEILEAAINESNKSLFSIVNEVTLQGLEHLQNSDTFLPSEHRDLSTDQLRKLQETAVDKIEFWARIDRLAEHPKLLPILYAWKSWGNGANCTQYIAKVIREPKGLLAFLGAALQIPIEQVIAKLEKNIEWKKYLDNISAFIPIEEVEPFAVALFEDESFEKLREKEQLSILIFLDLINAKTIKVIPKTTI